MDETFFDVIIAGAGPIGLFLACELAMRNVSVLTLERDVDASSIWKSEPLGLRGLNTPSAEHFYRRGLLEKVCDIGPDGQPKSHVKHSERAGQNPSFKFAGHFAGLFLDASKMEMSRWPYVIPGASTSPRPSSMERIEKVLVERAEQLGVRIMRGCGVSSVVARDDTSVTVEAGDDKASFTCKWLVGCDGGRSTVRKSIGFDFPGTEPTFTGYIALCEWDSPLIKPGWHITENGMYTVRPVGSSYMLYLADFDGGAFDRQQEIGKDHLQAVLRRLSGIADVEITKVRLASTFTDRCKQATTYRQGRVLLAGDAAHIHSPLGAQGLNLGIGDAMNLGWKLAATIQCEREAGSGRSTDFRLLDTYTTERHPAGAWVLEWQRAQVSIIKPDPWGMASRTLIQELISTRDGANLFIDRFWGLSQKYDLGDPHPLVGGSMPDFELEDGSRLGVKLEDGRGLLINFENDNQLQALVTGRLEVQYLRAAVKAQLGLRALYVRPDGVVAWVADVDAERDLDAAKAALNRWSV